MTNLIGVILLVLILVLGVRIFNNEAQIKRKIDTTLNMELVAVTPHGHQIYRKAVLADNRISYVYVLLRHGDGYPIAITSDLK